MMPRNPKCQKCELHALPHRFVCIEGVGNKNADLMLVMDAPGFAERNGIAYNDGRLRDLLTRIVGPKTTFFCTYLVRCQPAVKGRKQSQITKAQARQCFEYLTAEAERIQPKVTVLLGSAVVGAIVPSIGFSQMRGNFYDAGVFGKFTASYSPKRAFVTKEYEDVIKKDFERIVAFIRTGRVEVSSLGSDVKISPNEEELATFIEKAQNVPWLSSDIEANHLSYWKDDFVVTHCGFHHPEIGGVTIDVRKHPHEYEILNSFKQVVHNATFEGSQYGRSIVGDTLGLGFIRNPFLPKSLEEQGKIYGDAPNWKGNERNWEDWARRNAIDVAVTSQLYLSHTAALNEKQKKIHDEITLPASLIYSDVIQRNGLGVDTQYQRQLNWDLAKEMNELHEKAVWEHNWPKGGNLNASGQVSKFIYSVLGLPKLPGCENEGSEWPSSAAEFLVELALIHPFPEIVRKYRTVKKLQSNYIFQKEGSYASFVRPLYNTYGTVSGRPSSGNSDKIHDGELHPPGQTLPKGPRIRRSIVSQRGYFVGGDVDQGELKIFGGRLAKDRTMLELFRSGGDIHLKTAKELFGREDKEGRSLAKPPNFLLLYGGKARMLQTTALKNYGIKFDDEEAIRVHTGWHRLYSGVHEHQREEMRNLLLTLKKTSPLGMEWRFDKAASRLKGEQEAAWRDALNYPTQGTLAYLTLLGAVVVERIYPGGLCMTVHDELIGDYPFTSFVEAREFALVWKKLWEDRMEEYWPGVPKITVTMKIGKNLGDLKDVA